MYENNDLFIKIYNNLKPILKEIYDYDNYTCKHSIGVALLSYEFGKKLNLNEEKLTNLIAGSLLHDYGKLGIDIKIIDSKDGLTSEEFEELKKHPGYSFDRIQNYNTQNKLLAQFPYINDEVTKIAIEHHEHEDGTGYPMGKTSDEIGYLSKIVHITDVFDALYSQRSYKKEFTLSKIFSIYEKEKDYYDKALMKKFLLEMSEIEFNELKVNAKNLMLEVAGLPVKEESLDELIKSKTNETNLEVLSNPVLKTFLTEISKFDEIQKLSIPEIAEIRFALNNVASSKDKYSLIIDNRKEKYTFEKEDDLSFNIGNKSFKFTLENNDSISHEL